MIIIHDHFYVKPQKLADEVYMFEDTHLPSAEVFTSDSAEYFISFYFWWNPHSPSAAFWWIFELFVLRLLCTKVFQDM